VERVVQQEVLPEEPQVVRPGEPQVVRPEEPQAVRPEELQVLQVLLVLLEELQEPSVRLREPLQDWVWLAL
jgi:hypothetical protein